jgi:hypothetical protein
VVPPFRGALVGDGVATSAIAEATGCIAGTEDGVSVGGVVCVLVACVMDVFAEGMTGVFVGRAMKICVVSEIEVFVGGVIGVFVGGVIGVFDGGVMGVFVGGVMGVFVGGVTGVFVGGVIGVFVGGVTVVGSVNGVAVTGTGVLVPVGVKQAIASEHGARAGSAPL